MQTCDVLIVGGGPAGSSCAWRLCRAGMRVVVLDKKPFPRDKPCAGWITPQVVHALQLDVDVYRSRHVWQPIRGFRCGVIDGREVLLRYGHPISFGIRRCEFDAYLLQRARADCRLGEAAERIERRGEGWVVNGAFAAPLLVGAGGHFCPVARLLRGGQVTAATTVFAQEVEFSLPGTERSQRAPELEIPELYFCADLRGYGWCFRKAAYLNIGLGRADRNGLSTHVRQFVEWLARRRHLEVEIPARFVGHAYRLYEQPWAAPLGDAALLVGDAAGLAYPLSGEGIRPAVESGLLAAEVILQAGGVYGPDRLQVYRERLEQRLGKPRRRTAPAGLPAPWLQFVAARLLGTRWFARHVVMDRWFLHRQQPALKLEGDCL